MEEDELLGGINCIFNNAICTEVFLLKSSREINMPSDGELETSLCTMTLIKHSLGNTVVYHQYV